MRKTRKIITGIRRLQRAPGFVGEPISRFANSRDMRVIAQPARVTTCAFLSPRASQILSMRTHGNEVHATKSARGSTGNDGGRFAFRPLLRGHVPAAVSARARARAYACTYQAAVFLCRVLGIRACCAILFSLQK